MTEFCSNCGVLCCGKLKIEIIKGSEYKSFCQDCFNYFSIMKLKEVRKILKENSVTIKLKHTNRKV